MLDWIRFVLSAALTCFGLFVLVTAVLGQFRFRRPLMRIHAAALTDTLGLLSMILGVILALGWTPASLKLVAVAAFLFLTSPVSSHLIARLEAVTDDRLSEYTDARDEAAEALLRREREGK